MIRKVQKINIAAVNYMNMNMVETYGTNRDAIHILDFPGVYSIWAKEDCLYVGQSKRVAKRITSHRTGNSSNREMFKIIKNLNYSCCVFCLLLERRGRSNTCDYDELNILESLIYECYKPRFNRYIVNVRIYDDFFLNILGKRIGNSLRLTILEDSQKNLRNFHGVFFNGKGRETSENE